MLKFLLLLVGITATCLADDPEMFIQENDNFGGTKEDFYMNNFKGQYRYSFENPNTIKQFQDGFPGGGKVGFYSFVGPDGRFYITCYTAVNGYRAKSIIVVTDMPYNDLQEFCQKKFNAVSGSFGDLNDVEKYIEQKKKEKSLKKTTTSTHTDTQIHTSTNNKGDSNNNNNNKIIFESGNENQKQLNVSPKPGIDIHSSSGIHTEIGTDIKKSDTGKGLENATPKVPESGAKNPSRGSIRANGKSTEKHANRDSEPNANVRGGKSSTITGDVPALVNDQSKISGKSTDDAKTSQEKGKDKTESHLIKTPDTNIPLTGGEIPLTDLKKTPPQTEILIPVQVESSEKPGKTGLIFSSIGSADSSKIDIPKDVDLVDFLNIPIPDGGNFPESLDHKKTFDPTNGKKDNANNDNPNAYLPKSSTGNEQDKSKGQPNQTVNRGKPVPNVNDLDIDKTGSSKHKIDVNVPNSAKIEPTRTQSTSRNTNTPVSTNKRPSDEQKNNRVSTDEIPILSSHPQTPALDNGVVSTPSLNNMRVIGMRGKTSNGLDIPGGVGGKIEINGIPVTGNSVNGGAVIGKFSPNGISVTGNDVDAVGVVGKPSPNRITGVGVGVVGKPNPNRISGAGVGIVDNVDPNVITGTGGAVNAPGIVSKPGPNAVTDGGRIVGKPVDGNNNRNGIPVTSGTIDGISVAGNLDPNEIIGTGRPVDSSGVIRKPGPNGIITTGGFINTGRVVGMVDPNGTPGTVDAVDGGIFVNKPGTNVVGGFVSKPSPNTITDAGGAVGKPVGETGSAVRKPGSNRIIVTDGTHSTGNVVGKHGDTGTTSGSSVVGKNNRNGTPATSGTIGGISVAGNLDPNEIIGTGRPVDGSGVIRKPGPNGIITTGGSINTGRIVGKVDPNGTPGTVDAVDGGIVVNKPGNNVVGSKLGTKVVNRFGDSVNGKTIGIDGGGGGGGDGAGDNSRRDHSGNALISDSSFGTVKNKDSINPCVGQLVTKVVTQPAQTVTVTIRPTATQKSTISVPTALSTNSCRAKIVVEDSNKKLVVLHPTEDEMISIRERAAKTLNCGSLSFLSK